MKFDVTDGYSIPTLHTFHIDDSAVQPIYLKLSLTPLLVSKLILLDKFTPLYYELTSLPD